MYSALDQQSSRLCLLSGKTYYIALHYAGKRLRPPFLQALSKRVHYGKFVAEAKFLEQREEYTELIRRQDSNAIMDLLTNAAVEKQA